MVSCHARVWKDNGTSRFNQRRKETLISNNILSLVVRSTLKEGSNNPQRDIVQTYNYDLTNQKKITGKRYSH